MADKGKNDDIRDNNEQKKTSMKQKQGIPPPPQEYGTIKSLLRSSPLRASLNNSSSSDKENDDVNNVEKDADSNYFLDSVHVRQILQDIKSLHQKCFLLPKQYADTTDWHMLQDDGEEDDDAFTMVDLDPCHLFYSHRQLPSTLYWRQPAVWQDANTLTKCPQTWISDNSVSLSDIAWVPRWTIADACLMSFSSDSTDCVASSNSAPMLAVTFGRRHTEIAINGEANYELYFNDALNAAADNLFVVMSLERWVPRTSKHAHAQHQSDNSAGLWWPAHCIRYDESAILSATTAETNRTKRFITKKQFFIWLQTCLNREEMRMLHAAEAKNECTRALCRPIPVFCAADPTRW